MGPQNNPANEESANEMNVVNNESVEARRVDSTNEDTTTTTTVESIKVSVQSKV